MTAKFFAILTNQGAARLANATALGTKLNLTQLAIGDGGGVLPVPDPAQTALLGEKRRAALNLLSVDPNNTSQIIAEQIIPENEGGFWIREIGLFDDAGILIAIANCPETYKPQLQEGSGRTQTIRMVLIVSSTESVTLKIDPSVVLATRKYVDDRVIEVKAYADNLLAQHVAAADPHKQYAPKNSPGLTGKPTAPTAAQTENSTQLATTAFVKAALSALVASSPAALDTLKELADALGNDANFSTTVMNALAAKQPLDATLTALAGKDVAGLLAYLGLKNAAGYDVQSNSYDGTSGKVLQVGAFGIGSTAPTAVSDASTIKANGFYRLASEGLNIPVARAATELIHCQYDNNAAHQIAWRAGIVNSPMYHRCAALGVWADWVPFYDAKNKPSASDLGLGTAALRNIGTGSNQVPDMSSFTSGSGVNGWWKKGPDGVIEQYGIIPGMSSTGITSAFPIAFPNEMRALTFGITGNSGANNYPVVTISLNPATGTKLTHFTATGYNTGVSGITTLANVIFYYHAIGF